MNQEKSPKKSKKVKEKPPEKVKEKKKRQDVIDNKIENKDSDFVTVKTTMNSFIKSEELHELIREPLENILLETNKTITEAYLLSNLHVLRMLENKLSVIVDQDFYYNCLSAVSSGARKRSEIEDLEFKISVDLYNSYKPKSYILPDMSHLSKGVLQNLSLQMVTNSQNFIEMRFFKIFMRYLKHKYLLEGSEAYKIIETILGISKDESEIKDEIITYFLDKLNELSKDIITSKLVEGEKKEKESKISIQEVNEKRYLDELLANYNIAKEQLEETIKNLPIPKTQNARDNKLIKDQKKLINLENKYILKKEKKEERIKNRIKREQEAKEKEEIKIKNKELIDRRYKLFSDSRVVLPFLYEFLKYFEKNNTGTKDCEKGLRLFSILPTKIGFTTSYIKICRTGLYGLLRRIVEFRPKEMKKIFEAANLTFPTSNSEWGSKEILRKNSDTYWNLLFNIEKFETENRKFSGEISTDGKSVSISIKKHKKILEKCECCEECENDKYSKLKEEDFDEIFGLDPGTNETFVATNKSEKTISCSTKSYYHCAKYKQSNRIIKGWQDRNSEISEINHNIPSKKTAEISRLGNYISYLLPKLETLLKFHMEKGFRSLRLKRYIYSKKTLKQMCISITGSEKFNKRILVGFGDWSNDNSSGFIKKCVSGPVKKFENMLKKYCVVVPVDEFRTSKLHNKCGLPLTNQYSHKEDKDNLRRNLKVHSVLHCFNNGCNGITMNRDLNASKNIRDILLHHIRHQCRPQDFLRSRVLTEPLRRAPRNSKLSCKPVESGIITKRDTESYLV